MKVNELVEFVSNSKNKMLKAEQLQEVLKSKLEVKKYLSIKDKNNIVDEIVNECVLYEDGMFKFDDTEKYVCFIMKTIAAYTNLELSDDIETDYDVLCENDLLNPVIATFNKEYDEVSILLTMKCDYVLSGNCLEAQVGKFLSDLMDKVDVFANILSDKIGDFDLSKLPISGADIAKLMEFINTQK